MTGDPHDLEALKALTRFGFGPRPGDLRRIASDPRGAVGAELMAPGAALLARPDLLPGRELTRKVIEDAVIGRLSRGRQLQGRFAVVAEMLREEGRLPVQTAAAKATSPDQGMRDDEPDMAADASAMKRPRRPQQSPELAEIQARFEKIRACDIGFVERWVWFWANHFAVSARKGRNVAWLAGAYEREAIRPHALGRFADMVQASSRHPAMLIYLNLENSTGPNSRIGQRGRRGLNENYARELLELHTVGVDGGYSQEDVTALARALTGWRKVDRPRADDFGAFQFVDEAHEPGPKTVMGKTYPDQGEAQGEAILADLARKPATARHIARRVAIAFVSDEPPPALVSRLERSFIETGGDLKELARTLISADDAWEAPRAKMRSAQEFVFGLARAVGGAADNKLIRGLRALDQAPWRPPSPKGFSIYGRDWIAPDAQTNRLDLAVDIAERHGGDRDPNALADDLLGDVMSDETSAAVKRAGSREQALALLLMSPEMQRR